ncbi:hypothetical protein FSP39_015944 [Pinctada imbricata]|uniref:Integrase p58-like C-terminal domain-containing protein n=1 Tax=Pinctada imbricata TaxID=66713 RepID=A0AA88Y5L4_PINIB|nr:hypothetical protein FSP39_015944 [Pinctada imbricata]
MYVITRGVGLTFREDRLSGALSSLKRFGQGPSLSPVVTVSQSASFQNALMKDAIKHMRRRRMTLAEITKGKTPIIIKNRMKTDNTAFIQSQKVPHINEKENNSGDTDNQAKETLNQIQGNLNNEFDGWKENCPAEHISGLSIEDVKISNLIREENISKGSYLQDLREKLNKAHVIARKHLQQSANYHKCRYDQKASITPYHPGDYVLYLHEERKEGECSKLHPLYHGPFVVVQRINDLVYRVQMDSQGKMKVVNYNKLKPYKGEKPPKWGPLAVKKFQKLH